MATAYEPPEGITPAEAATLVDEGVAPCAILATIVDLAMRGYIEIERSENLAPDCGIKDFALTLLKSGPDLDNLASFERVLLEGLFFADIMMNLELNAKTTLSSAGWRVVRESSLIEREIHRSLEAKRLHVRSGDWHYATRGTSSDASVSDIVFGLGIFCMLGIIFYETFHSKNLWVLGFGMVAWLILMVADTESKRTARRYMRKTPQGRRKRAECQGFKDFLNRVDGDRLKRMPPEIFEKYLPYAMAFGLEQKWSEGFDGLTELSDVFSL